MPTWTDPPVGDAAGQLGSGQQADRGRELGQPGLQRAEPATFLEVQGEGERDPVERDRHNHVDIIYPCQ